MHNIPSILQDYIKENIAYPVGIIGCRATDPETSLECCEYDLAIFGQQSESNKVLNVGNHTIELINLPIIHSHDRLVTKDMILMPNKDCLLLPSFLSSQNYANLLRAFGRKLMISSALYHQRIMSNLHKSDVMASIWLKLSAYDFLEGLLAVSGFKPMPIHELSQIRQLTMKNQVVANAVKDALECIGLERASTTSIRRSSEGLVKLRYRQYDTDLFISKVQYMLKRGMLSDCYYYIGKIAARDLIKNERTENYDMKLTQTVLDLNHDVIKIERLHANLFVACKLLLNY